MESLDLLDPMRAPQLRSLLMENLSDRFMRQIAFALFQRMRHSRAAALLHQQRHQP